jgi:hypothetical protein
MNAWKEHLRKFIGRDLYYYDKLDREPRVQSVRLIMLYGFKAQLWSYDIKEKIHTSISNLIIVPEGYGL